MGQEKGDNVEKVLSILGTIATIGGALWEIFGKKKG